MPFIQLKDGIVVEIRETANAPQLVAGGPVGIPKTLEQAVAMLPIIISGIGKAFKGMSETLNVPIKMGEAEVELGLSFSMEGNLFVAKSTAEATLTVKIKFTPVVPTPSGPTDSPHSECSSIREMSQ